MIRRVPNNARLEIKFVANESELSRLQLWLKLHSANFFIPFPDRWVNNVYFDTHCYSSFNENLSGASYRTKVRYRWYEQREYPSKGTLEIKCKRNYFGWKLRFPVAELPDTNGIYWREIRQNILNQLHSEAKKWLDAHPQPVLINRYYRQYFVTRDEKIRATIDTHQTMYDQRYKPYPNITHAINIPKTVVMEFKFDRSDCHYASQILQGLPLRVSRNSKYMTGVKGSHGY